VKKRLIKKKVKQMNNKDLNECVAYETNRHWRFYAEKEFDKRIETHNESYQSRN